MATVGFILLALLLVAAVSVGLVCAFGLPESFSIRRSLVFTIMPSNEGVWGARLSSFERRLAIGHLAIQVFEPDIDHFLEDMQQLADDCYWEGHQAGYFDRLLEDREEYWEELFDRDVPPMQLNWGHPHENEEIIDYESPFEVDALPPAQS